MTAGDMGMHAHHVLPLGRAYAPGETEVRQPRIGGGDPSGRRTKGENRRVGASRSKTRRILQLERVSKQYATESRAAAGQTEYWR